MQHARVAAAGRTVMDGGGPLVSASVNCASVMPQSASMAASCAAASWSSTRGRCAGGAPAPDGPAPPAAPASGLRGRLVPRGGAALPEGGACAPDGPAPPPPPPNGMSIGIAAPSAGLAARMPMSLVRRVSVSGSKKSSSSNACGVRKMRTCVSARTRDARRQQRVLTVCARAQRVAAAVCGMCALRLILDGRVPRRLQTGHPPPPPLRPPARTQHTHHAPRA
jgi:hypothetical protein